MLGRVPVGRADRCMISLAFAGDRLHWPIKEGVLAHALVD